MTLYRCFCIGIFKRLTNFNGFDISYFSYYIVI